MGERRILVVDDDDAIRALLFTVLRRRGFRVDTAANGAEAIEKIAQCAYAVILLDLMMPRLTGYEVLDELSRFDRSARPVAIVLTAGGDPHALDPDIVAATIRKPFDLEMLVETLMACVSSFRSQANEGDCPPADSDKKRGDRSSSEVN